MTEPQTRTFEFRPDTWWGRLFAAAALLLLVGLAVVFFTVFLGLLAVGAVVAPLVGWWHARKLRRAAPPAGRGGAVIDVEYEVRDRP